MIKYPRNAVRVEVCRGPMKIVDTIVRRSEMVTMGSDKSKRPVVPLPERHRVRCSRWLGSGKRTSSIIVSEAMEGEIWSGGTVVTMRQIRTRPELAKRRGTRGGPRWRYYFESGEQSDAHGEIRIGDTTIRFAFVPTEEPGGVTETQEPPGVLTLRILELDKEPRTHTPNWYFETVHAGRGERDEVPADVPGVQPGWRWELFQYHRAARRWFLNIVEGMDGELNLPDGPTLPFGALQRAELALPGSGCWQIRIALGASGRVQVGTTTVEFSFQREGSP